MEFLASDLSFNTLSLEDVLRARAAFHVHLMHKANVVGTAVGRYLIRKTDPFPPKKASAADHAVARTLDNSEVRGYSWPCVLVFVAKWVQPSEFGQSREYDATDLIPGTIYMPDGRRVPVCVVEAPLVTEAESAVDPVGLSRQKDRKLSGGYPLITNVQNVPHVASVGCLMSDGHTTYMLTSRHVAGAPGRRIAAQIGGRPVDIGTVSDKQIGAKPFEELYPGWPGQQTVVNMDVALIELDDARPWSAAIYQLGQLGPLADISTHNLSLNIIGCPVRARGGVSGVLTGRVAGLFFRYKAVGGREYVADFIIGSQDETPLSTHPGDSGSVWVLDTPDAPDPLMPLAVQWGGAVFGASPQHMPFALATNFSNVCRELGVDVVRASHLAQFEYWGAVGHYTIGSLACGEVQEATLQSLMLLNQDRVSFAPGDIGETVNDISVPGFVQLADVPDKVWKFSKSQRPFGRKGPENPNHYADIDLSVGGQPSLDEQTPSVASLKPETWRAFYKAIGWNAVSQRGMLPFRVWQIFIQMQKFAAAADVSRFVCAAGILAHYVGDACQPLHGSQFDDGDPFRKPDGTPSTVFLKHGSAFGHGVHGAYESSMLDANYDHLISGTSSALHGGHGMPLIQTGQEAGFATIELMRRTRNNLNPKAIVEVYAKLLQQGRGKASDEVLWTKFGTATVACVADGCRVLAMLWDSAWASGGGAATPASAIKAVSKARLRTLYEDPNFLPSKPLGQIDDYLKP